MKFCLHGSNFRRKLQSILEHLFRDSDKNTLPLLQRRRARDKGLRDIGHSTNIGNLILGVNSVTLSYLIPYDSLLQNATDIITKCNSYFIKKCASFITKCDSY